MSLTTSRRQRSHSRRASIKSSSKEIGRSTSGLWTASRILYLTVLLVAPWTLGGVHYQTQSYLYAGLIVSGVIWLIAYLTSDERTRNQTKLPLLILPLVVGVIYASTHLIPIFSSSELGPSLDKDLPASAEVAGFVRNTISIYPLQTRMHLATLSMAVLAFFLSVQLFSNRTNQVWLFGVLALSGLALSFFGLCQKLSWNGHLFWSGPEIINGKPFAAWVNRNNAAGYLNMTFAASLGMLVWSSCRKRQRGHYQYDALQDGLSTSLFEKINACLVRIGQLTAWQVISGTSIVIIAAGVIASASRGGILSLIAGFLVALIWFWMKGHKRIAVSVFLVFSLPVILLLSWLGLSEDVKTRFRSEKLSNFSETLRFQNWSEASRSLPEIWLTGSGFGTYRYFYRPYQQHSAHGVYEHAENQYLETLIESGVFGFFLLLFTLLLALLAILRLSRSKMIGDADGVAIVGLVTLATQATHAFLDYGMTVPSNMLLMATLMGAVTGRAVLRLSKGDGNWYFALPAIRPRVVFVLFAVLLIGNGFLGWGEISRAAIAENAIAEARTLESQPLSEDSYRELVSTLIEAISKRPDDVHLHLHLANVYIQRYETLTREMLRKSMPENVELTDRQLEQLSSLQALYRQSWRLEQSGQAVQLEELKQDPIIKDTLIPARSVLLTASSACNWLPQTELSLAYLSILEESPEQRVMRLQRVAYLSPYEPHYLYYVGKMALIAGEQDLCLFAWRRTFEQTPHFHIRQRILASLNSLLSEKALNEGFFRGDAKLLRLAINDLRSQANQEPLMENILAMAEQVVDEQGADPDVLYLDSLQKYLTSDYEGACGALADALTLTPEDLALRRLYVESLIASGNSGEAQQQIEKLASQGCPSDELNRLKFILAGRSPVFGNE